MDWIMFQMTRQNNYQSWSSYYYQSSISKIFTHPYFWDSFWLFKESTDFFPDFNATIIIIFLLLRYNISINVHGPCTFTWVLDTIPHFHLVAYKVIQSHFGVTSQPLRTIVPYGLVIGFHMGAFKGFRWGIWSLTSRVWQLVQIGVYSLNNWMFACQWYTIAEINCQAVS